MSDFELQYKRETLEEIQDNLNNYQDLLRELERDQNINQVFDELFRLVHNIKGNSKSACFNSFSTIVHLLENKLISYKEKKLVYNNKFFNLLNSCLSAFLDAVDTLKKNLDANLDFSKLEIEISNLENESNAEKQYTFLVIDDEVEITEILDAYLREDFDCTVIKVSDSEQALTLCEKNSYDLIITDFRMPKIDGQRLVQTLRYGNSLNKETSIIFASSFNPILVPEVEVWKNVFILEKPFNKKNLEFIVKCSLNLKNKQL